ncbi:MAG: polyprenol monophosphomannose synthase [Armatimonadetes bacterium]|nr:polyprenol monophosphomannose synthase [Armatimonadota bacterium]
MTVWVVLPTYNEAANLERMIAALLALELGVRVVIVDDDSPDGTGEIADRLAAARPEVRVIHRAGERGLGTAYLAGFRHALAAGATAVLTMDCDFSHDPAVVPNLAAALAGADLVIGSRYVPGGGIRNWPIHRRWLSRMANRFVRLLFHLPAADCTSGFRLYRRHLLEAIPWEHIRSSGYSFLVETLYWAARQPGTRIREVPICFTDRVRGKSKLGLREAVCGAGHLLRLRFSVRGRPGATEERPGGG